MSDDKEQQLQPDDDSKPAFPNFTHRRYKGHIVYLIEDDWRFAVEGPEFRPPEDRISYLEWYYSYKDAIKAINDRIEDAAKALANTFTPIPIRSLQGAQATLRGINRATSNALTTGLNERDKVFLPDVNWLVPILHQHKQLAAKLAELEAQFARYCIKVSWGYGRLDATGHAEKLLRLAQEVKSKRELAEANTPAPTSLSVA